MGIHEAGNSRDHFAHDASGNPERAHREMQKQADKILGLFAELDTEEAASARDIIAQYLAENSKVDAAELKYLAEYLEDIGASDPELVVRAILVFEEQRATQGEQTADSEQVSGDKTDDGNAEKRDAVEAGFDLHKSLVFLQDHIDHFFRFTPDGNLEKEFQQELMQFFHGVELSAQMQLLVTKMLKTAEQLGTLIRLELKTRDEVEEMGLEIVEEIKIQFEELQYNADGMIGDGPDIAQMYASVSDQIKALSKWLDAKQAELVSVRLELVTESPDKDAEPGESDEEMEQDADILEDEEDVAGDETSPQTTKQKPKQVFVDSKDYPAASDVAEVDGMDYPFTFIEGLNDTVVFATKDPGLVQDWITMEKIGFLKGKITTDDVGNTVLTAHERVLPWIGHLKMKEFFDYNQLMNAKHPGSLQEVENSNGDIYPEIIFLDDSRVALEKYMAGPEVWEEYKNNSLHYVALKNKFGITE